ncbi:MAG: hypothetical protein PHT58_07295 [Eubacteriales bacterium]|nr:hypothetical protein [Eubacteriales bacterium]
MANDITAIKNREIRGCIIRALGKSDGRPISQKSLAMALISVTTDIAPHLYYLGDKGYIRVTDVGDDEIHGVNCVVQLTAKGIDLLEGSIADDPGVTI